MSIIRSIIRNLYDIQSARITAYNRLVSNAKERFSSLIDSSLKEAKKERKYAEIADQMISIYDLHHEDIEKVKMSKRNEYLSNLNGGLIDNYLTYINVKHFVTLRDEEKFIADTVSFHVKKDKMWDMFFKDVKGIGPIMSAVLLSEVDIHKTPHVSNLWSLCGLDVVKDLDGNGKGRSRCKEHLKDVEYIDKNGNKQVKKSLTFNPFLKSKMIGVLATSFIMHGGKYRKIYEDIKNRYTTSERYKEHTKAHIEAMSRRYMIKMFLKDFWVKWREVEGYPYEPDYWTMYISGREHHQNYNISEPGVI